MGAMKHLTVKRWLIPLLALKTAGLLAAPVFLGVATEGGASSPAVVFAGQKNELVLTLTAAEVQNPQLSADLAVVAGTLAAPVFANQALELRRMGEAKGGVQRFKFVVDFPHVKQRQTLVLRLRVRLAPGEAWLPLPPVAFETLNRSWQDTLRRFSRQLPSGRLAESERVAQLFHQAQIETPETPAGGPVSDARVRVWFAEAGVEELALPEIPAGALWIVFKPGIRNGLEVRRVTGGTAICVVVDDHALVAADTDPAAQEILERALATAQALVPGDLEPPPS